jgi:hypothetical protein
MPFRQLMCYLIIISPAFIGGEKGRFANSCTSCIPIKYASNFEARAHLNRLNYECLDNGSAELNKRLSYHEG